MKILKKIWWLPLLIYMTLIPSFMADKYYHELCREIKISIKDSMEYRFITPGSLLSMVQEEKLDILGSELYNIDLEGIEDILKDVRELEEVEVFTTADGILHIDADQRDPLMRVITSYGNNYYIDKNGFVIPHSITFTPRLIVVSGNISVPDSCIIGKNIFEQDENSIVKQTFRMVEYINGDEFWSRFIEQIWINEKGELELVPRVGEHLVKFGSADDFEWKFRILRTFYKEKIPAVGWDKYDEIDMRFNGQLVCTRK